MDEAHRWDYLLNTFFLNGNVPMGVKNEYQADFYKRKQLKKNELHMKENNWRKLLCTWKKIRYSLSYEP